MSLNLFKYYSLALVIAFLSFQSCSTTQKQVVEYSTIEGVKSYYQELVPGQENIKSQYNLYIELMNTETIVDSVKYIDEVKPVKKRRTTYYTDLGMPFSSKELPVIVYYHKDNKAKITLLENITIKEPIHLP